VKSRRAAHQERQTLARELATFSTPADRLELDAILARHTEDEARLVRQQLRELDLGLLFRLGR
jgi:hypothetical protein